MIISTASSLKSLANAATIDDLIERGMRIVRELDPIMRNLFEDEPGKLAAWLSASRVERALRRKPKQQTASPQTTATGN